MRALAQSIPFHPWHIAGMQAGRRCAGRGPRHVSKAGLLLFVMMKTSRIEPMVGPTLPYLATAGVTVSEQSSRAHFATFIYLATFFVKKEARKGVKSSMFRKEEARYILRKHNQNTC